MKLSSTPGGLLSNKPVFALLALYMPIAALAMFVFLLREFLRDFLDFQALIPVLFGCAGALAASFYCDFMKDQNSGHSAANVRGGIIILLISYLASSLLNNRGSAWNKLFLPDFNSISASLGALYAWNSVISLKRLFGGIKRFDEYAELYRGRRLQEAFSDNPGFLQYTNEEIVKTRNSYLRQLVIAFLILTLAAVFKIIPPSALYFLMILVLESVVCFLGFLGSFSREQYYAGEGIVLPPLDRAKRVLGTGILCGLCAVCAFFLSFNKSILSLSPIIDFLRRLLELFRRSLAPKAGTGPPVMDFQLMDLEPAFSDLPEAREPWPIWTWLKYFFIALAAAGFGWFMVSPLFNSGGRAKKPAFLRRLGLIIREWFTGVLNALISLAALAREGRAGKKLRKHGAGEILKMAETVLGAYSQAKRRDMRRSVTLFARLIIWGGEVRHITWKPSHAPGEYCGLLAASTPAAAAETPDGVSGLIIRAGELFEKALYSAEVLSGAERKEFKNLVEEIISSSA